ncbi:NAD-dependent dehydratase [Ktedonosporobacter rubrisoli]|uniref:NAD-dependent dehydratase n=1 Tax=Ktedonosporobacter rubrisoli TaxID=2509675 RepID=A0A4P6JLI2_KTERU|nr:NAD-dependent epimerase/dehydratase family protein [Ktedonosporobacter rubrisoli]QBD76055.1 NAD-dependent dehydratase [Ktedonosporobacter rubrisoli]
MRILVIGGTGSVGTPVVRQLVQQGHQLMVMHRGKKQAQLEPGVESLLAERARLPELKAELKGFAPEVVLDIFPLVEREASIVVESVRGIAQRVVGIGSADVYRAYGRLIGTEPGPIEPTPLSEDAPLRQKLYPHRAEPPRSADDPQRWMDDYDKIPVERAFMGDSELSGTILRLPMIYGPGDRQHRNYSLVKRMQDRRPAIVLGQEYANWLSPRGYIDNVAAAIVLATTDARAAGRIYNVAEEPPFTTVEWVRKLAEAMDWHGNIVTRQEEQLPASLKFDANAKQHLSLDTARIRQELGYREPVGLDEAIKQTIAWELNNPPAASQLDYAAEDALLREA